jgi:MutS-like protein
LSEDPADLAPDQGPSVHPLTIASIAVAGTAFLLAAKLDVRWLALLVSLAVLLPLRTRALRRLAFERLRDGLRAGWGRPVKRTRDLAALRRLFAEAGAAAPSEGVLDDATWDDLDLDAVFEQSDRTLSTCGEYVLYEILRTPVLDLAVLAARERRIDALGRNEAARDHVRIQLTRLGREPLADVAPMLWGPKRPPPEDRRVLALRAVLPLVGGAALALGGGGIALVGTLAVLATNAYTHYRSTQRIQLECDALRHLASLVRAAARIADLPEGGLPEPLAEPLAEIRDLAKRARVVASASAMLAWTDQMEASALLQVAQLAYDYTSTVFLNEERTHCAILALVDEHREDLRRLFRLLGEFDALQSAACWRAGLPAWRPPELVPGAATLAIEDAVHPLVENAVPNSVVLGPQSLVVTGSNMSGKSTFLRTVGLQAVLAQTLHTCLAKSYRGAPLRVASSVTIRDDVTTGRSFYLAEAERLLRLLRAAESPGPVLVLVDEPLRGTNSTERIAAVSEILLRLAEGGALTVAATHELKIAELTRSRYAPCHFTDEVGADGLAFPHRLVPGVATTRNAIRLLGQIGYPPDLVERADARAAETDRAVERA